MRTIAWLLSLAVLGTTSALAANFTVGIGDDYCYGPSDGCFYPSALTINAGDSVTFYVYAGLLSTGPHNVVADDGSFRCARGCDGEGGDGTPRDYKDQWSFTRTFNTPGVVRYHDEVGKATGTIRVQAANTAIYGWESIAITDARTGHTATRLGNGRVLVAGGSGPILPIPASGITTTALNSAGYFIPTGGIRQQGIWQRVGPMTARRSGHTATLLQDNGVLVIGGGDETPEIFSPVTESWSRTHPMYFPRNGHTATLLADGTVLVVGGGGYVDGTFENLKYAELYDPRTGVWTAVPGMNVARHSHTATLLADGRVLVTGGAFDIDLNSGYIWSSTEIYDPATRSWTKTSDLQVGRTGHRATLLPDGRVLIGGGYLDLRFTTFSARDAQVEIFDPSNASWTFASNPKRGFDLSGIDTITALDDGRVLVVGNQDPATWSNAGKVTQVYTPTEDTWATVGSLNVGRIGDTATLLHGGKVLVAGGHANSAVGGILTSAEVFSIAVDRIVEYYNQALDHYFITASRPEQAALDSGRTVGWMRTEEGFDAWINRVGVGSIGLVHPPGLLDVCRAYIPPAKGDSHLYSTSIEECWAAAGEDFGIETYSAFLATLPDIVSGACATGQTPVYRLWNKRVDTNHRYTASLAVRDSMVARGYIPEGYGPSVVAMCVGGGS